MLWKTILPFCLALLSTGCHSAPPPQSSEASGDSVVMLRESVGEERTAKVGEAILGVSTTQDGRESTGVEIFYLGLTDNGRIKLQVVKSGSGPVELDLDPHEPYVAGDVTVEFIEAQASWVRYRLSFAGESPE